MSMAKKRNNAVANRAILHLNLHREFFARIAARTKHIGHRKNPGEAMLSLAIMAQMNFWTAIISLGGLDCLCPIRHDRL